MRKINLAISGCMGRMGQQLIKSVAGNSNFKIVSLTENRKINKKILGIIPELNSENAFNKANIIIDLRSKMYSEIEDCGKKEKSCNRDNRFL